MKQPERPEGLLCGNPECGAWIDPPQRGVPFLDRDKDSIVMLCPTCDGQVGLPRYQRIEPEGEASE